MHGLMVTTVLFMALVPLCVHATVNVWPYPQTVTEGTQADVAVVPGSKGFFLLSGTTNDIMTNAVSRYDSLIFGSHTADNMPVNSEPHIRPHSPHSKRGRVLIRGGRAAAGVGNVLAVCEVSSASVSEPLQLGVDESYNVNITSDPNTGFACTITSQTPWGTVRALETMSQLIAFNFDTQQYQLTASLPLSIQDAPRFPHRGMLIDSSRHYMPLDSIKRVIDGLAYSKFNTLHWHIVDSQAFPFESKAYPKLWEGAYTPAERYTQADVRAIREYAQARAIRVVLEFDGPGHAASWGTGYPQLLPAGMNTLPLCNGSNINNLPLDPSNPMIYQVFQSILSELTSSNSSGSGSNTTDSEPIITDSFFHFGGDEVVQSCWSASPAIAKFMKEKGFTTWDQLEFYYITTIDTLAKQANLTPIHWEEVFNKYGSTLPGDPVIEVWLDHPTLQKVVAAGYRGILANQDSWYLSKPNITWQQVYTNEPLANITDPAQQKLVLGGETCVWGEQVDASDIDATMWPRGAAAGERLWSSSDLTDPTAAQPRLARFRCLLNIRGIPAAPLNGPGRAPPPQPGACPLQ